MLVKVYIGKDLETGLCRHTHAAMRAEQKKTSAITHALYYYAQFICLAHPHHACMQCSKIFKIHVYYNSKPIDKEMLMNSTRFVVTCRQLAL